MAEPRERMHWSEVGLAARTLAEHILEDDYRPDMLLSIARGGLVVGGALAYALEVKNTFTMNVEFYVGVDERLPVPMILPPVPELVDLDEARMLIADDVADTGRSQRLGRSPLEQIRSLARRRAIVASLRPTGRKRRR